MNTEDRVTLVRVAKSYNDLIAAQTAQRVAVALMLRVCAKQLKHPDSRERDKAIAVLGKLADMMEK